jgi:hypothetical protein
MARPWAALFIAVGAVVVVVSPSAAAPPSSSSASTSPGCGQAAKPFVPKGTTADGKLQSYTLKHGKRGWNKTKRDLHVHVPSSYDSTQDIAVVLAFHGWGQSGEMWTQMADDSERFGFVLVAPDGLSDISWEDPTPTGWKCEWRVSASPCMLPPCCGQAAAWLTHYAKP